MSVLPTTIRQLVSEARTDGTLELRIEQTPLPRLEPGQVLVRIEAAPLHPSDLGMMLPAADLARAERIDNETLRIPMFEAARPMLAARVGKPLTIGNEGAGTVIAAGDAEGEALIGHKVAAFAGGMYADYRVLPRTAVTPLPEGASARDGAAISVNPLTALAMVEVMRRDGATALVHTAAASSLGQILQRICAKDGIPLINIVRRPEQEEILRKLGAKYVLNSQSETFATQLREVLAETNATVAFDAIGGGPLAGTILTAMEQAQARRAGSYSVYGAATKKQVYMYGRLDTTATTIPPSTGMAWGISSFLLPYFLQEVGAAVTQRLVARVLDELTTTFAIRYTGEIGLDGLLDPDILRRASAKTTGEKFLLRPDR